MKGKKFRALIDSLGLTQVEAAALFGAGERTMRHWVADEYDIPGPAARLAVLLAALKETGQHDWAIGKIKGVK